MFIIMKKWKCNICGSEDFYYPIKKDKIKLKFDSFDIRCKSCDGKE